MQHHEVRKNAHFKYPTLRFHPLGFKCHPKPTGDFDQFDRQSSSVGLSQFRQLMFTLSTILLSALECGFFCRFGTCFQAVNNQPYAYV